MVVRIEFESNEAENFATMAAAFGVKELFFQSAQTGNQRSCGGDPRGRVRGVGYDLRGTLVQVTLIMEAGAELVDPLAIIETLRAKFTVVRGNLIADEGGSRPW